MGRAGRPRGVLLALLGLLQLMRRFPARRIEVSLTADWATTALSPVSEAFESLMEESPSLAWRFLAAAAADATALQPFLAPQTDVAAAYDEVLARTLPWAMAILEEAGKPRSAAFLPTGLAARMHAPAVEAQRKLPWPLDQGLCEDDTAPLAVVYPGAKRVCDPAALPATVASAGAEAGGEAKLRRYPLDHAYAMGPAAQGHREPTTNATATATAVGPEILVLAPFLGGEAFAAMHRAAAGLAEAGDASYVLRHAPAPAALASETALAGYGVHLDIKNMEYRNMDEAKPADEAGDGEAAAPDFVPGEDVGGIDFATLAARAAPLEPGAAGALRQLRDVLLQESMEDATDLPVWEIAELGLRATAKICAAHDPLRAALDVAQNFPVVAATLSNVVVPPALRAEVEKNVYAQLVQTLPGAGTAIYVNGVRVDAAAWTFNVFKLLAEVKAEGRRLDRLRRLRLSPAEETALLRTAYRDEAQAQGPQEGATRVDLRPGSKAGILFLNNLEKDAAYDAWPDSLVHLLYAGWSLARVRRNAFTSVHILDPATPRGRATIRDLTQALTDGLPVRFGLVLLGPDAAYAATSGAASGDGDPDGPPTGVDVARLCVRLRDLASAAAAWRFLTILGSKSLPEGDLDWELVYGAFGAAAVASGAAASPGAGVAIAHAVLDVAPEATEDQTWTAVRTMKDYADSKGLPADCRLLNGAFAGDPELGEGFMQELMMEQYHIGYLLQARVISPTAKSIFGKVLTTAESVVSRWHPVLAEAPGEEVILNLEADDESSKWPWFGGGGMVAWAVVGDLGQPRGQGVARDVVAWVKAEGGSVALVSMGDGPAAALRQWLETLAKSQLARDDQWPLLDQLLGPECVADLPVCQAALVAMAPTLEFRLDPAPSSGTAATADTPTALPLEPGATVSLFANGRRLPLRPGSRGLVPGDLGVLHATEAKRLGASIAAVLPNAEPDRLFYLGAVLTDYARENRYDVIGGLETELALEHTGITAEPHRSDDGTQGVADGLAGIAVAAILDPLSSAAPRLLPALLLLRDALGVELRVALIPRLEVSELPRKAFYRFVSPLPGVGGHARADFEKLPRSLVLTLGIDAPEAWDVQTALVDADVDVDNLRCPEGAGACGVEGDLTRVEYRLKGLLVAGQCYSWTDGAPPNGLQLVLVPAGAPANASAVADTLVMQNLGYWQMKAGPGAWELRLAPGRATGLFEIVEDAIGNGPAVAELATESFVPLYTVDSFEDRVRMLRVRKRPGMEEVPLLGEEDVEAEVGLFGGFFGRGKGGDNAVVVADPQAEEDVVHVFSLATGKLYERLLKIMMLSVVKACSVKVKFWLFENFLTPTFKRRAVALAEAHGVEVEFVTYKWPGWLRQQTEKQRIIWGYKILFLDVLFPLNVKKVIYVDADQVVRGDLKELRDMDLEGAPYGYTPFCDSREETLGYQFWRSGYWKDHLQGRPYHISALYVVDLERFRRGAVGDALRAVYDNLSRDPNSLSNLDQDLPNYAQHQVPIFSLPQEWLWCESWCSDESKAAAKTIDLCNNPRFKENKLDMARRVIQGELFTQSWDDLDLEIAGIEAAAGLA